VSSNKYASGSNQNCGNVMTGRSSTRLHAPPGGTSQAGSLIFGGGDAGDRFAGHRGRGGQRQQTSSISFGNAASQEPFKAKAVNNQVQHQQQTVTKKIGGGTSANAFATGTNQNCGNFITDRPTSRVLAPPGGKSSGPLW
jgi:SPIRAL1-like protein